MVLDAYISNKNQNQEKSMLFLIFFLFLMSFYIFNFTIAFISIIVLLLYYISFFYLYKLNYIKLIITFIVSFVMSLRFISEKAPIHMLVVGALIVFFYFFKYFRKQEAINSKSIFNNFIKSAKILDNHWENEFLFLHILRMGNFFLLFLMLNVFFKLPIYLSADLTSITFIILFSIIFGLVFTSIITFIISLKCNPSNSSATKILTGTLVVAQIVPTVVSLTVGVDFVSNSGLVAPGNSSIVQWSQMRTRSVTCPTIDGMRSIMLHEITCPNEPLPTIGMSHVYDKVAGDNNINVASSKKGIDIGNAIFWGEKKKGWFY